jgi:hypothetical protein
MNIVISAVLLFVILFIPFRTAYAAYPGTSFTAFYSVLSDGSLDPQDYFMASDCPYIYVNYQGDSPVTVVFDFYNHTQSRGILVSETFNVSGNNWFRAPDGVRGVGGLWDFKPRDLIVAGNVDPGFPTFTVDDYACSRANGCTVTPEPSGSVLFMLGAFSLMKLYFFRHRKFFV